MVRHGAQCEVSLLIYTSGGLSVGDQGLAGDIVSCSWARRLILTVALSILMYN